MSGEWRSFYYAHFAAAYYAAAFGRCLATGRDDPA
jgi:hypothetical protein